jgi:hypothetical protein
VNWIPKSREALKGTVFTLSPYIYIGSENMGLATKVI